MNDTRSAYGYYANQCKTWLIVKEELYDDAQKVFHDTRIHITTTGRRYLGSTVGNDGFKEAFVSKKVAEWTL